MTNLLVGQSGGPTAAINASLAGVINASIYHGIKVYAMEYGIEGILNDEIIDIDEYIDSEKDLRVLSQTPSSFLGSCRVRLPKIYDDKETYEKIFGVLNERKIDFLIYIGGNDSMDTLAKLSEYGEMIDSPIRFIGIPKTIDNDLVLTDHTPGYGSAAKYVSTVVKETRRDIESYKVPSLTIVEIMGRNAGWLAASSALAETSDSKGPDLIYVCENIFNLDEFVEEAYRKIKEKTTVLVAISEGLKLEDGRYLSELSNMVLHGDNFGHLQLTGAGAFLSNYIHQNLGVKTRGIEINSIQRSAGHILSKTDIDEAYRQGEMAVSLLLEGLNGKMVSLKRVEGEDYRVLYTYEDVKDIANKEKKLPEDFYNKEKHYVTDKFIKYAKPLIQGQMDIIYEDGLPKHITRIGKK